MGAKRYPALVVEAGLHLDRIQDKSTAPRLILSEPLPLARPCHPSSPERFGRDRCQSGGQSNLPEIVVTYQLLMAEPEGFEPSIGLYNPITV
jgi:hypothetical protein